MIGKNLLDKQEKEHQLLITLMQLKKLIKMKKDKVILTILQISLKMYYLLLKKKLKLICYRKNSKIFKMNN